MFTALYLTRDDDRFEARVCRLGDDRLPAAERAVTVAVAHSTLNYKDGLAITDRSPVVRRWPMVAGIDGAGVVETSEHPDFGAGDRVVLNGYGVGETHWGCLAQRARLAGDWLVRCPAAISTHEAMAIGTAGYTAMLSILALEDAGLRPDGGDVLVTGASGGVGSIAVALLSTLGYRVVASTGRLDEEPWLKQLGAAEVVDRATLSAAGKPLQKERWAAAIDSVGSHTLANVCAQMRYGGLVTACGLAQGMDFPASVAPFILRRQTARHRQRDGAVSSTPHRVGAARHRCRPSQAGFHHAHHSSGRRDPDRPRVDGGPHSRPRRRRRERLIARPFLPPLRETTCPRSRARTTPPSTAR